jgi:lipopolysaccharide/colanic/teichoic acid biosynthesis glycosyltransferase
VGPRPEQPTIFASLRKEIDQYQERQRVRPGITGWAQINQQYDRSIEDVKKKLAYDLQYITQKSVTHDLQIMMRTFGVITRKQGAW